MANKRAWNRCTNCSWTEVSLTERNQYMPTPAKDTLCSSFWHATCIDSSGLQTALVSPSVHPFLRICFTWCSLYCSLTASHFKGIKASFEMQIFSFSSIIVFSLFFLSLKNAIDQNIQAEFEEEETISMEIYE